MEMTDVRALTADAVAQHRARQVAIARAAHELELLLQACARHGVPVTGERAITVARLTIGTYHATLDQAAGLTRG